MSGFDMTVLFGAIGFMTGWFDARDGRFGSAMYAMAYALLCGAIAYMIGWVLGVKP